MYGSLSTVLHEKTGIGLCWWARISKGAPKTLFVIGGGAQLDFRRFNGELSNFRTLSILDSEPDVELDPEPKKDEPELEPEAEEPPELP